MDQPNTLIAGQENTDTGQQAATGEGASAAGQDAGKGAASQGEKPGETGQQAQGDKKGEEGSGAPEQYEAFKFPEGVQIDKEIDTEFQTLAKDLNLSQEAAQKTADLGAKMAQKWATQQQEQIVAAVADWGKHSQTDKEIGGDNFKENVAVAKHALEAFGTPELRKLLNDSGLGNHPEVIRVFYRAGKAISEDRLTTGGGKGQPAEKPVAQRMYPNMNP